MSEESKQNCDDENADETRKADEKTADEKDKQAAPPPLGKKIPEPPDNLRRRSEWFRKRSE